MKKIVFLVSLFLTFGRIFPQQNFPLELFNQKLTSEELEILQKNEVLFHDIKKLKNICVNKNSQTEEAINTLKKLNPNHLSEIIQVRKYEGSEKLIPQVSEILRNVESYKGIPYWSVQHQRFFDLYSEAEILNVQKEGNREIIDEKFYMAPFGYYTSRIEIEDSEELCFFTMVNTEKLLYKGLDAVKKGGMMAAISIFRYGDYWIIYGLGGADIIKLPFIERRANVSFTNRIKSFAIYLFDRLQQLQLQDS